MGMALKGDLATGMSLSLGIVNRAAEVVEVTRDPIGTPIALVLGLDGRDEQIILPVSVVQRLNLSLDDAIKSHGAELQAASV